MRDFKDLVLMGSKCVKVSQIRTDRKFLLEFIFLIKFNQLADLFEAQSHGETIAI